MADPMTDTMEAAVQRLMPKHELNGGGHHDTDLCNTCQLERTIKQLVLAGQQQERDLLGQWLQHSATCNRSAMQAFIHDKPQECSCGLAAAIRERKPRP